MGQRLAGGSRVVRGLARSGEVGELGRGLLVLILDLVGDRTCKLVTGALACDDSAMGKSE